MQINPEYPLWVDVREFERIANSRWQIENSASISHLQSAINYYHGDLLADLSDWFLRHRAELDK